MSLLCVCAYVQALRGLCAFSCLCMFTFISVSVCDVAVTEESSRQAIGICIAGVGPLKQPGLRAGRNLSHITSPDNTLSHRAGWGGPKGAAAAGHGAYLLTNSHLVALSPSQSFLGAHISLVNYYHLNPGLQFALGEPKPRQAFWSIYTALPTK